MRGVGTDCCLLPKKQYIVIFLRTDGLKVLRMIFEVKTSKGYIFLKEFNNWATDISRT